MSATEELRRLLDERGVEWLNSDGDCCDSDDDYMLAELDPRKTTWSVDIAGDDMTITAHEVYENDELEEWFDLEFHEYFTLEQVIAATLGSEFNPDGLPVGLTISDDGNLLNWRGENYVKQSTLGSGTLTAEQVRETVEKHWHDLPADYDMPESSALPEYSYDWQAIADELNAVLGGGECKVVASSTDGLTTDEPRQWFRLSCGHAFKLDGLDAPVACPVCGKAVKR